MSFVDRVLARQQERAWPVGKGALVGWEGPYGHDQSQFSPEEYGDYLATSNDIYSIVSLRARMMQSLELNFYEGRGSKKKQMDDSPAAQLFRFVNPHWTRARLTRMDELSMGVWGESFWAIEYDRGVPKEIWWLKASRVQPVTHESDYVEGYAYLSVSGEVITFRPEEIVWHRYPNPLDEFSPLSPLAASRLAADSAMAMMKANNQAFSNGMSIAGLVVPPGQDKVVFSDDQAKDLEIALKRKFVGAANAHKWAVLRHEAKFVPMQMNQKDAEFLGGLNMTFRMACRAYGIPAPLLGDMENATLANLRELQRGAWEQTLLPDAGLRAEEIEEQYLTKFRGGPDHCEYNADGVPALQESASESWAREMQALDRGGITINEWREKRGWAPVDWGNKPYMPANKGQVDDEGMVQVPVQPNGKKLPDDEANPSTKPATPRILDHMEARRLLASFRQPLAVNGARR